MRSKRLAMTIYPRIKGTDIQMVKKLAKTMCNCYGGMEITIREMKHRYDDSRGEPYMGHQNWIIESDPSNPPENICRRGDYWYWGDKARKGKRAHFAFGYAQYYYDWEF